MRKEKEWDTTAASCFVIVQHVNTPVVGKDDGCNKIPTVGTDLGCDNVLVEGEDVGYSKRHVCPYNGH